MELMGKGREGIGEKVKLEIRKKMYKRKWNGRKRWDGMKKKGKN